MALTCRLCHGETRVMLSLTPTPLANSFPDKPNAWAVRFPNEIEQCLHCGHVQHAYHATVDWQDYRYQTPEENRARLAAAAEDLKSRYPTAESVLEIGSNNGLYLEELRKVGFQAMGVDPNAKDGIAKPFSSSLAKKLGTFDLIVANNVLAHVDDLWDVFLGIDRLLGPEGALVFEVQDLDAMLAMGSFDMMYHEHRDYHDRRSLVPFLRRWGLEIVATDELFVHGGSVRYYCERPVVWRRFAERIAQAKRDVYGQLLDANGPIACFGATAKACTLIHHFGLAELIDYCVDATPAKQGRYIPGTTIQIFPESQLAEVPPAAVLMTAWNFKDVLVAKYPQLHWVIPFEEGVCR